MTRLLLVEDEKVVGYVDTESGEAEYKKEDPFIQGLVVEPAGDYIGAPADDLGGPNQYFIGEELEEYIKNLPDEFDEVDFEVIEEGDR